MLFIRQGKVLGSRSYFPKVSAGTELVEVVQTFIGQFYLQINQMRLFPDKILTNVMLPEKVLLSTLLSNQADKKFKFRHIHVAIALAILKLARTNATTALVIKLSQ